MPSPRRLSVAIVARSNVVSSPPRLPIVADVHLSPLKSNLQGSGRWLQTLRALRGNAGVGLGNTGYGVMGPDHVPLRVKWRGVMRSREGSMLGARDRSKASAGFSSACGGGRPSGHADLCSASSTVPQQVCGARAKRGEGKLEKGWKKGRGK